jgi:hypothetical protein
MKHMASAALFSAVYDQAHGIYDQAHGAICLVSSRKPLLYSHLQLSLRERQDLLWYGFWIGIYGLKAYGMDSLCA